MAIVEVSALKAKFEPGDSPKSSDFINLIDTLAALPVADVAANGIPSGGTTGQVLVKVDGTNYNTQWSTTDLSGKQDVVANVSSTEIGYLDGVTSAIQTQLDAKLATATASSTYAPLANPALTGVPTAPTAAANTNTTQIATTAYVQTEIADLIASAPGALDTLDELAAALGDDSNYAATITTALGLKAPLAGPTFTGTVVLPSTTSIGDVSATEIGYIDGVTSSVQTQINTKASTGKAIAMSIVFGG